MCRYWHRPRLSSSSNITFHKFLSVGYSPLLSDEEASERSSGFVVPLESFRKVSSLSCSSGDVILVEHLEERPPLVRNFAMAVRIVVYLSKVPQSPEMDPHGIISLLPKNTRVPCLGGDVSKITVIEDNNSIALTSRQKVNTPPGTRDYLLVVTRKSASGPSKLTLRKISGNIFTTAQQQPKTAVYSPDSHEDKMYVRERLMVSAVRHLSKSDRVSKTTLQYEFPMYNESKIKTVLKELCDYESTTYWRLKPGVRLPTEDQLRQKVSPDAVVKQEARVLGNVLVEDVRLTRFKSAQTTVRQAGVRYGRSALVRYLGDIVDSMIAMLPWKHTGAYVDTIVNSKGLLRIPDNPSEYPLGLFTYVRVPQKPEAKAHRREDEPKSRVVTGTDADLRRMDPAKAKRLLMKLGMSEDAVDELERWERVGKLRELSTEAAAAGNTDPEILCFARNDKVTLKQQEKGLRERASRYALHTLQVLEIEKDLVTTTRFAPSSHYFQQSVTEPRGASADKLFEEFDMDTEEEGSESEDEIINQRRNSMPRGVAVTDSDPSLATLSSTASSSYLSQLGTNSRPRSQRLGPENLLHLPVQEESKSDGSIRKIRSAVIREDLNSHDVNLKRTVMKRVCPSKDNPNEFIVEYVVDPKDADALGRRARTLSSKLKSLYLELSGKGPKRKKIPKVVKMPEEMPRRHRVAKTQAGPPTKISRKQEKLEEEEVIHIRDRSSRKRMSDAHAKVELNKFIHTKLTQLKAKIFSKNTQYSPLFIFVAEPDYKFFYDYKNIVAKPLWIDACILKTSRDEYVSREDFLDDVRLMVYNAHLYNSKKDWYQDVIFQIELLWTRLHELVFLRDNDLSLARLEQYCAPEYHAKWRKERGIGPDDPIEEAKKALIPSPPKDTAHVLSRKQEKVKHKIEAKREFNEIIASVTRNMKLHSTHAPWFVKKPLASDFPTYRHFVKRPFSLSEIEQKAVQNKYSTLGEVRDDLQLIVDNAIAFNGPLPQNQFVIDEASFLRDEYMNIFAVDPDIRAKVEDCFKRMGS
ncbi:hypothetical protein GEMRC1_006556 [Eukaryota sp. GEM-RC1]